MDARQDADSVDRTGGTSVASRRRRLKAALTTVGVALVISDGSGVWDVHLDRRHFHHNRSYQTAIAADLPNAGSWAFPAGY